MQIHVDGDKWIGYTSDGYNLYTETLYPGLNAALEFTDNIPVLTVL